MANFKILVADNDESFRQSLAKDVLEPEGYQVFQAGSPDEARLILDKELIHLAIVDIRLTDDDDPHDTSGFLLCGEMDSSVARIVLTAYPPEREPIVAFPAKVRVPINSGFLMLYLLTKQVGTDILLEAVREALREEFDIVPERRIAVLTSGGDSPGMNAAIWAVVRSAMGKSVEVMGVQDGYRGLVENDMAKLPWNYVSTIMEQGGTILGSGRYEDFTKPEVRKKAIPNIRRKRISGLVMIGGDGSMNGAKALANDLQEEGEAFPIVAIPGTIDNDLWGTDMSLGAASAADAMINQLRNMIRPAQALRRIFVVEVMGAFSGYLALQSALGIGADAVIIPEQVVEVTPPANSTDSSSWRKRVKSVATQKNVLKRLEEIAALLDGAFSAGKRFGFVVLAEGVQKSAPDNVNREKIRKDLEDLIKEWDQRKHPDVRSQELGYPVRGVSPNRFDIWLGARLGMAAVDALLDNKANVMVGWSEETGIIETPFDKVVAKSNRAPKEIWQDRPKWQEMLTMQKTLACPPTAPHNLQKRPKQ